VSTAAIVTICIVLGVGWLIALLVGMLSSGPGGMVTFFITFFAAILVAAAFEIHDDSVEVGNTREAIEKRYDVDFSTGWFDRRGRGGSFYKDGALYECDIKGIGDKARMFCDEPPRPEFNN
jgi:hypothetical protein